MEKGGWTYILTDRPFGVLYVGVTSDLAERIAAHREGRGSDFCHKWKLTRLVLAAYLYGNYRYRFKRR